MQIQTLVIWSVSAHGMRRTCEQNQRPLRAHAVISTILCLGHVSVKKGDAAGALYIRVYIYILLSKEV